MSLQWTDYSVALIYQRKKYVMSVLQLIFLFSSFLSAFLCIVWFSFLSLCVTVLFLLVSLPLLIISFLNLSSLLIRCQDLEPRTYIYTHYFFPLSLSLSLSFSLTLTTYRPTDRLLKNTKVKRKNREVKKYYMEFNMEEKSHLYKFTLTFQQTMFVFFTFLVFPPQVWNGTKYSIQPDLTKTWEAYLFSLSLSSRQSSLPPHRSILESKNVESERPWPQATFKGIPKYWDEKKLVLRTIRTLPKGFVGRIFVTYKCQVRCMCSLLEIIHKLIHKVM